MVPTNASTMRGSSTVLIIPATAAGTLVQVQAAAGCTPASEEPEPTPAPTETPAPTGEPSTDLDPPYESCAEAIADGAIVPAVRGFDDSYQPGLDSDGDGVACEAGEGTPAPTPAPTTDEDLPGTLGGSSGSGSGTVDSVPSGSVDTGYVA